MPAKSANVLTLCLMAASRCLGPATKGDANAIDSREEKQECASARKASQNDVSRVMIFSPRPNVLISSFLCFHHFLFVYPLQEVDDEWAAQIGKAIVTGIGRLHTLDLACNQVFCVSMLTCAFTCSHLMFILCRSFQCSLLSASSLPGPFQISSVPPCPVRFHYFTLSHLPFVAVCYM